MKESIESRIKLVKEAEDPEDLKKHLCPFFEKGGYPECMACRKTESDLDECRDYYLERIATIPMDLWTEDFDKFLVKERDTVDLDSVVGIGINCDSCYMYDKCPLYKKGFACGIKWDNHRPGNPTEFMDFLINTQYERVKRASVFEKIDGGVPDAGLSGEMDRLHDLVASKIEMGRERLSINVEATGSVTPTGGGGILAKLFGGGNKEIQEAQEASVIEIPAKAESLKGTEIPVQETEPMKVKRQRKK